MEKIELAAQCPKCGNWNGVTTSNLHKSTFMCKRCGCVRKVRNKKGWNVTVKFSEDQELSSLVAILNK